MRPYTMYLHAEGRAVPSIRVLLCSGTDEARAIALRELESSQLADRIEVVNETGEAFSIPPLQVETLAARDGTFAAGALISTTKAPPA